MTYESYMAESEYLQHHGVLGMKWGVRRYQPYPDNYRGDGKFLGKRERQLSRTQDRIERSVAKARKAAEKGDVKALNKYNKRTARLTKKEQKQIGKYNKALNTYNQNREIVEREKEAEKQKFLATASAADVYENKNKYEFTKEDLDKATNRILSETKIESIMQSDKRAKMDATSAKIHSMVVLGQNAVDAFNTYERVADVVNKVAGKSIFPEPTKKLLKKEAAEKNAIMRSVDLETIVKNRDKLTPDEFTKALQSIKQLEQTKLQGLSREKATYDYVKSLKNDAKSEAEEGKNKLKNIEKAIDEAKAKAASSDEAIESYNKTKDRVKELKKEVREAPYDKIESKYKEGLVLYKRSSDPEKLHKMAYAQSKLDREEKKLAEKEDAYTKAKTIKDNANAEIAKLNKAYDATKDITNSYEMSYDDLLKKLKEFSHSDDSGEFLEHHGIKGQHWGVKNGPPYPLGKKTHDRVVGRSNTKKYRTKTKAKTGKTSSSSASSQPEHIRKLIASGKAKVDNLPSYSVGGLTTFTTKFGEEYVSGLTSGHDFDWQELSMSKLHFNPDSMKMESELTPAAYVVRDEWSRQRHGDWTDDESHEAGKVTWQDMRHCNPDFGKAGTTQNCAKCSSTLELALRGYYVTAGRQSYPSTSDAESLWWKGAKRVDLSTDVAEDALKGYGRSSGTIDIRYPEGRGGHSMHWTVDDDGNFEIQDGQNGRRFSSLKEMTDTYGADVSKGVSTFRLDNCEPDWDMLAQDSVVRPHSNLTEGKVKNRITGKTVDTW